MDLAAIKQLAEDLNYEGQDLRNFVDKQIQLYEDELNRSSEKDEREERMKKRELDLRERELQAREKEREHENKTKNARLLRYALSLQPFAFKVEPIKGTENCISDILSRF